MIYNYQIIKYSIALQAANMMYGIQRIESKEFKGIFEHEGCVWISMILYSWKH